VALFARVFRQAKGRYRFKIRMLHLEDAEWGTRERVERM
jgi:hypothetical protein